MYQDVEPKEGVLHLIVEMVLLRLVFPPQPLNGYV